MTKALIFGAGGVGCIYGYFLHTAGVDVTAVCRSNYTAVRDHGITIRSKSFGTVQYRPTAVTSAAEARSHGPFDYVLVCSKAFPGTSTLIQPVVSPTTTIVLAQNGIDIEPEYATLYPLNPLLSGVVWLPTTQISPGLVDHITPLERFEIGTYPSRAPPQPAAKQRAHDFSALFAAGGFHAPVSDDIQTKRWIKVAVNGAWNSLCALTACDDANVLRSSAGAEDMVRRIMRDIGAVARAAGYDVITDEVIEWDLDRARARLRDGGKEPSMLTDVRCGRGIEVEAILGNVVRVGRRCGLGEGDGMPYLELLYVLLRGLDFGLLKGDGWMPPAKAG